MSLESKSVASFTIEDIAKVVDKLKNDKKILKDTNEQVQILYGDLIDDENQALYDALVDAGWDDEYEEKYDDAVDGNDDNKINMYEQKKINIDKQIWNNALQGKVEGDSMVLESDSDDDDEDGEEIGQIMKKISSVAAASATKKKSETTNYDLDALLNYHNMTMNDWNDLEGDEESKQLLINDYLENQAAPTTKKEFVSSIKEEKKPIEQYTPKDIINLIIQGQDNEEGLGGKDNLQLYLNIAKTALKGIIKPDEYYKKQVCGIGPDDEIKLENAKKRLNAYKEIGDDEDKIREWTAKVEEADKKFKQCKPFKSLPKAEKDQITQQAKEYGETHLFPATESAANLLVQDYSTDQLITLLKGLRNTQYGDYKKFPFASALRAVEEQIKELKDQQTETCRALMVNTILSGFQSGDLGSISDIDTKNEDVMQKVVGYLTSFIAKLQKVNPILQNLLNCESITEQEIEEIEEIGEDEAEFQDEETRSQLFRIFSALFNTATVTPKYDITGLKIDNWNQVVEAAKESQEAVEKVIASLNLPKITANNLESIISGNVRKIIKDQIAKGATDKDILELVNQPKEVVMPIIADERSKLDIQKEKAQQKKVEADKFRGWPTSCTTNMDDDGNCPENVPYKYIYNKKGDECCFTIDEQALRDLVAKKNELTKNKNDPEALKQVKKDIEGARKFIKRQLAQRKKKEQKEKEDELTKITQEIAKEKEDVDDELTKITQEIQEIDPIIVIQKAKAKKKQKGTFTPHELAGILKAADQLIQSNIEECKKQGLSQSEYNEIFEKLKTAYIGLTLIENTTKDNELKRKAKQMRVDMRNVLGVAKKGKLRSCPPSPQAAAFKDEEKEEKEIYKLEKEIEEEEKRVSAFNDRVSAERLEKLNNLLKMQKAKPRRQREKEQQIKEKINNELICRGSLQKQLASAYDTDPGRTEKLLKEYMPALTKHYLEEEDSIQNCQEKMQDAVTVLALINGIIPISKKIN